MDELFSELARVADVDVPSRPALAPWIQVVALGDGRVDLRGSEFWLPIRHPMFSEAFTHAEKLLDGTRELPQLLEELSGSVDESICLFMLKWLASAGCLLDGSHIDSARASLDEGAVTFLTQLMPRPDVVAAAMANSRVSVDGDGELPRRVAELLLTSGLPGAALENLAGPARFPVSIVAPGVDLGVLCLEGESRDWAEAVNNESLRTKTRWILATINGPLASIGPTVVPRQSPCYRCFDLRWRSNVGDVDSYDATRRALAASAGSIDAFTDLVAARVAVEVLRIISPTSAPSTIGRFHEVSFASPDRSHTVLRLPRCPSCRPEQVRRSPWGTALAPHDMP